MINNINTQKNIAKWKDLNNLDIHLVVSKAKSSLQPLHFYDASPNTKTMLF
jgi:hypothetical protein